MKVDFYRHGLGAADAAAIADVLASPFLTTGQVCRSVERQLCEYFSVPHATLVNSWTNGALAVLLALDIGPGDEVIVPAMTFIATANVVCLTGATPVFADVDPGTLLLMPESVAQHLSPRTKAVMPVHLYGQLCDMTGMRAVIEDRAKPGRKVHLIEDAAHCFEGERDGLKPGQVGDVAVFSFYATKNVTCGEGGAIICRDADIHQRILEARLHGMSAIAVDRFAAGRYNHWDMRRLGTKANLPDLLAALLPKQIATIDERLPARARLANRYREAFAGGPLRLPRQLGNQKSAEHIFPIGVPARNRDNAIAELNAAGVSVTVNYRAVPDTAYYGTRIPSGIETSPVAVEWGRSTLTLPLFPGLTEAEQDHVIATVRERVYPLAERK